MKYRYISQQQQFLRALSAGIGKTAVILPAAFLTETGLGMLTLGMVFYMREVFFLSPGLVGWIAATWQSCYVLGCLTMRPAFESLRPRYSMIFSTAGMGVAVAAILISRSVVITFLFYGLFGFCLSFFWPPLMSWLSLGIEGKHLGRAMSRLLLTGNVGIIISPFLAGALSSLSPRYPLFAAAGLFSANCLVLIGAALVLPKIRSDQHKARRKKEDIDKKDQSTTLRYPAWIGLFVTYTVVGVIITVFPMYARDVLGMSKSTIGILLLCRALCTALGFVILGRTTFWHFRPLPMVTGLALLALLVFGISQARSLVLLVISVALIGPLISLGFSYSFFHGASGASRRATRMAIHEALLASGLIAGSAVGGHFYQHYSMTAVSFFCAALLVTAIGLQVPLIRLWRSREGLKLYEGSCSCQGFSTGTV
jgi:DHA1 family multidrug resistance protein-like MFS transporter/DHA1 family quinolone resistance protein-like MFS transporter